MSDNVPLIDVAEFRERGYLQEVNRCFLHPLGLALAVVIDDDGTERLGGVWDYRDDPEGIGYAPDTIDLAKAARVAVERVSKIGPRVETFGAVVQPVPPSTATDEHDDIARRLHEAYERLSPEHFGGEASGRTWDDVPASVKALMRAAVAEVFP